MTTDTLPARTAPDDSDCTCHHETVHDHAPFERIAIARIIVAVLGAAAVWFRLWEPLSKTPPSSGVGPVAPWLDRLLYAPLAIESGWLRAGGGFPLGQSILLLAERTA